MNAKVILAVALSWVGLLSSPAPGAEPERRDATRTSVRTTPAFPLKLSADRRYLVDQNDRPFLVIGDSPWSIIVEPTPAQVDLYLDDRVAKGFSLLLVSLLEHKFSTQPPKLRDGTPPFVTQGNFATPNEPYFLIETAYEGEHKSTPDRIRRQGYWPLLDGAFGILYGNSPVWHFGSRGVYDRGGDWVAALNSRGARDMARLAALFRERPWWRLRPDRDHQVVTAGYGTFGKLDYVATARASDGTLALTYLPATGTANRELTVDLGQLAGPLTAHWFNPTDGGLTPVPRSPFADSGPRQLKAPGDNGSGANDWLLILETAADLGSNKPSSSTTRK